MANIKHSRLSGRAKFLVDFGPLLVFLAAYFLGGRFAPTVGQWFGQDWEIGTGKEMYLAIALFMPAFAGAFVYSVWKERRIAPMLLISGLIISVMGTLTLVLQDKTFFFMKPTLVYALFASLLLGGLASGRNFLKTAFDEAVQLPDNAWRTLTIRFVIFFVAMALINEGAWRWLTRGCDISGEGGECAGEATWVNLKIFGFTLISMVFMGAQVPFLMKHGAVETPTDPGEPDNDA